MVLTAALYVLAGIVVLGATLRLTRFVTTDWLGDWLGIGAIRRWATRHENAHLTKIVTKANDAELELLSPRLASGEALSWQARFAKGLTCPFCVGYWIGLALLGISAATFLAPAALVWAWWIMLGALASNYLVGHVSSRID